MVNELRRIVSVTILKKRAGVAVFLAELNEQTKLTTANSDEERKRYGHTKRSKAKQNIPQVVTFLIPTTVAKMKQSHQLSYRSADSETYVSPIKETNHSCIIKLLIIKLNINYI